MRLLVLKSGPISALMKWLGVFNVTFTEACVVFIFPPKIGFYLFSLLFDFTNVFY